MNIDLFLGGNCGETECSLTCTLLHLLQDLDLDDIDCQEARQSDCFS